MKNKNTQLLGEMDVKKALIKLSIPATIGMMVNALYNLVDSLFVGWGAGEVAIGGLTLAFPIQMIIIANALMLGIGGASVYSRAYGRNDQKAMHNTINTVFRFGAISGFMISMLGLVFLDELLLIFDATPDTLGFAKEYLQIILIGTTFQTLSMILNNFTRAEGRAKVAMTAMVIGTGLNIILDPIFIFDWGLGLGVTGAAMATVISQVSAFLFIFMKTFEEESLLRISFRRFWELDKTALTDTIKIGLPTFIRNSAGALLALLIIRMIATYAPENRAELTVSIYGVVNRVIFFIFMPGFGLVQGMTPIAGYNFGAKNWERLKEVIIYATKLLTIYFIGGFIFVQFGATLIFDIFSSSNDTYFIETGARIFRIISLGFVLITFQIIVGAVYQSFGYAKRAMFISLSRQFIFFIPIAFVLTAIYGLDGLWYTFAIADILSGLIAVGMLYYEIKVLGKMMA